ncbi:hypothetical protein DPMN_077598 [Dreissena polymorpha]|uniref:Uncharacterized protein n=1 Tax=Dreissena polymorpha TaxID=45954 RepID=A0A9D4BNF9_DREPO|nr:hypothetical protein DPMN_077598 [Dreissena polymorpha]
MKSSIISDRSAFCYYGNGISISTEGNSLDFKGDSDSQYIVLNQEIKQKNHQGGASSTNLMSEKRIYATGECLCPVKILELFVRKQSPNATMRFNQFDNNAILHPESSNTWYTEKPLA